MTPESFYTRWAVNGEELLPISGEALEGINIQPDTYDFLTRCGLPADAAPFLSFRCSDFGLLSDLYTVHEEINSQYLIIGLDGYGNPIALNTAYNDRVEYLDHEDFFNPRFMNSSISKLAAFILEYRDFVGRILNENGTDAFLEGNYTASQLEYLIERFKEIDPLAIIDGCFWSGELHTLLINQTR
jgi:hypothetical protein